MCNYAHPGSRIPKEEDGKAWKIFKKTKTGKLRPLMNCNPNYTITDDWAVWKKVTPGGFCLLQTTKKHAELIRTLWEESQCGAVFRPGRRDTMYVVKKVEYRGAFAIHMENDFISGYKIPVILVKAFRPVDGWGIQNEKE